MRAWARVSCFASVVRVHEWCDRWVSPAARRRGVVDALLCYQVQGCRRRFGPSFLLQRLALACWRIALPLRAQWTLVWTKFLKSTYTLVIYHSVFGNFCGLRIKMVAIIKMPYPYKIASLTTCCAKVYLRILQLPSVSFT